MKIKKTVGNTPAIGRKSYTIHTECGQEFKATPSGSQSYDCNGMKFSSLKAIKAYVLEANDEAADVVEMNESGNLWDCIDPCALLIINMLEHNLVLGHNEMTTLDHFGWLTENGKVDSERAKKEFARISS